MLPQIGRCRTVRLSIRWVVSGCGMQLREPGGTQGSAVSNSATGICADWKNEAVGFALHDTKNWKMLMASNGAPYGPSSSWVPTK